MITSCSLYSYKCLSADCLVISYVYGKPKKQDNIISHLGGGGGDVAEAWSACTADVWISQQTAPYCKSITSALQDLPQNRDANV